MAFRLIYLITWRYIDGSASGAVSAHGTEEGAARIVELLNQHGDGMKRFAVIPTPFED